MKNQISERIVVLEDISRKREMMLKRAPAGRLRVNCGRKNPQYYQVTGENLCGRYLGRHQRKLAAALAQKDYDKKVLCAANRELQMLKRLNAQLGVAAEDVYDSLPVWRKALVEPGWLPDDVYIRRWEQEKYFTKGIRDDNPEFRTRKGEQVRSKSEILIANTLQELGIPYRYECELELEGGIVIYPDFTVLHVRERKEKYLEHFGMMDDAEYSATAVRKLALYEKNGIFPGKNLIISMESSEKPASARQIERLAAQYLK